MIVERSYLFVPATKPQMISKALKSKADAIILDIEDSVAHVEKESARLMLTRALGMDKKKVLLRINDYNSPYWQLDILCAIQNGINRIMIPKTESAENIEEICNFIKRESQELMEIIPLIETAKGIHFTYEIAKANRFVSKLAFGSIDYSLDTGCELSSGGLELLYARSKIVNESKAVGLQSPIDTIFPDLTNTAGLKESALYGKKIGFKSKMIIHPNQIDIVNDVFSPTEKEIKDAQKLIQAFEEAEKKGIASIKYQNQLIDYPMYKKAKNLLTIKLWTNE